MCILVGQRRCTFRRSCDAADASLSSECFNWGGRELSCHHTQGFTLATLQLLDAGRGGPRLPRRSRVGKKAELQSLVGFHQLVVSPQLMSLLLLFWHSAKISIARNEHPVTSPNR